MLKNNTYDWLKFITLHILPAVGTLIFALSQIWGWGWGEPVVGTISAVTVCLATVLGISKYSYDKKENTDDEGGAEG